MSSRKGYRKYTQDDLEAAIGVIKQQFMSIRQASKAFNVPRSTLQDKVNERVPLKATSGPDPVLKKDEEQRLVDWCLHMARIGYGRTRGEFLDVVQRIIQKDERPTPFKDSRPGKDWYYQFLKRHPELVEKETNELGKERALVSSAKVQHKMKYILYLLLMN